MLALRAVDVRVRTAGQGCREFAIRSCAPLPNSDGKFDKTRTASQTVSSYVRRAAREALGRLEDCRRHDGCAVDTRKHGGTFSRHAGALIARAHAGIGIRAPSKPLAWRYQVPEGSADALLEGVKP